MKLSSDSITLERTSIHPPVAVPASVGCSKRSCTPASVSLFKIATRNMQLFIMDVALRYLWST